MSDVKWTPGPWRADEHGYQVRACNEQMNVCDIRGWGHLTGRGAMGLPEGEAEDIQRANAHLIAAAPELYVALEESQAELECVYDELRKHQAPKIADPFLRLMNQNRAALAKARGQS